jgi:hypothetical protein
LGLAAREVFALGIALLLHSRQMVWPHTDATTETAETSFLVAGYVSMINRRAVEGEKLNIKKFVRREKKLRQRATESK